MTEPGEHDGRRCCSAPPTIGRTPGLRYVYAGNLPGAVGDLEDTRCASCGETLVARYGYHIRDYRLTRTAAARPARRRCQAAGARRFDGQIASRPFVPGSPLAALSIVS